ncbi:metal ABC transporter permease [Streptococcus hillyeri]|uniref:Metal ABC transporter permease n=1 Tax=Streptococcus hillyeri TaxID=2282420 RepID=A0A3L9DTR5_9STRE|nr:metal ABC transporter permease [Streptococcus hillyeri]RLY04355.1 metal ABC transporter permease [Streptococcus hillyeri]
MLEVLTDYSFITVAIGITLFALATCLVGTISVLTKQSLVGDTLGHASYPGVIVAFMVFQSRNPFLLMLGAMFSGYLSYTMVYWIKKHSGQPLLNILSLVSVSFFGLGMVLKQLLQGNPHFAQSSQAGLQNYLFGQAAFIRFEDILLIAGVSSFALIVFGLTYPAFKLYLFDQGFAQSVGISTIFLQQLIILLMISLIAVGLKVVGAVLISAFLIAPATIGLFWAKHYRVTLILAAISAIFSTLVGTYLSSIISGLSTGPTIILVMSLLALMSYSLTRKGGRHV